MPLRCSFDRSADALLVSQELTRYKERNEELENQVAAHGERALPQDQQAELESLRLQMHDLSATSAKASTENAELQRRMSALQSDYERRLQEEKDESASQLRELETQLDGLDKELEKVQHDLEETLAVNNSLNQELTSALKSPTTSTRSMGVDNSELQRLEQELTLAQNKAEWVQRENAQLEERCLAACVTSLELLVASKLTTFLQRAKGQHPPRSHGGDGRRQHDVRRLFRHARRSQL